MTTKRASKPMETPTSRKCAYCQREKEIGLFYPNKSLPGGYGYQCKSCNSMAVRKSSYRKEAKRDRKSFLQKVQDQSRLLQMMIDVLAEQEDREDR